MEMSETISPQLPTTTATGNCCKIHQGLIVKVMNVLLENFCGLIGTDPVTASHSVG